MELSPGNIVWQLTRICSGLYFAASLIPSVSIAVRRLHDTNRRGWWLLFNFLFIFMAGNIVCIVLLCQKGQPESNKYGKPDEKPQKEISEESMILEKNITELENIIDNIKEAGANLHAEPSFGRIIDLLCSTSLYVCAKPNENLSQDQNIQIVLLQANSSEVMPVFTRKDYADTFASKGETIKLEPEKLLFLLNELDAHIVINPNRDKKLIIDKGLFKNVIFEEFIKKYKAKATIESHNVGLLERLICNYILETEQENKMKIIMFILSYLELESVWVPFVMNMSETDLKKFVNAKRGEVVQNEDKIHMKPDIIKHASGKMFLPVFSRKEEAPQDYASNFSWMNISFSECCELAKNHGDGTEIIINAFTNALPITNDLMDIIISHNKDSFFDGTYFKWNSALMDAKCIKTFELTYGDCPIVHIKYENGKLAVFRWIDPKDAGMFFSDCGYEGNLRALYEDSSDDEIYKLSLKKISELFARLGKTRFDQWETDKIIIKNYIQKATGFCIHNSFTCSFYNGVTFKCLKPDNSDFKDLVVFLQKFITEVKMAEQFKEDLIKKYKRQFYERDGFIYDSLQDSQEFKKIEEKVDKKVERMLKKSGQAGLLGSCHSAWNYKKEILKKEYGIDWLSPQDLNPHITFD